MLSLLLRGCDKQCEKPCVKPCELRPGRLSEQHISWMDDVANTEARKSQTFHRKTHLFGENTGQQLVSLILHDFDFDIHHNRFCHIHLCNDEKYRFIHGIFSPCNLKSMQTAGQEPKRDMKVPRTKIMEQNNNCRVKGEHYWHMNSTMLARFCWSLTQVSPADRATLLHSQG